MKMAMKIKMVLSMASLAILYATFSNLVPNLSEIVFFVAIAMGLAEYLSNSEKQYLICSGNKCGEKIELPDDVKIKNGFIIRCPKCQRYNSVFIGTSEKEIVLEKSPVV